MRPIWSGSLTFGLINIPIKLYKGTEEKSLNLDMLHKSDLSPIRYARVCRADGKEIPYDQVVKGYEFQDGDYVVLTDDDFKKISPEKTKTINVTDFVQEEEIASEYFEKPYFLEPEKGAEKAYVLLRDALKKTKKVGVGSVIFRNRENLGIVKSYEQALVFEKIRYEKEIRNVRELNLPEKTKTTSKELDLAIRFIDELSTPFKAEQYKDTYAERLEKIVAQKAKGRKIKVKPGKAAPPTAAEKVMEALRASLEQSRKKHTKEKVKA